MLKSERDGFKSCLHSLIVVGPSIKHLSNLNLSFILSKIEIIRFMSHRVMDINLREYKALRMGSAYKKYLINVNFIKFTSCIFLYFTK